MNVLIVDDQISKQDVLKETFESLNASKITCVISASQMYSSLKEEKFDLIILDNCFKQYPDSPGVRMDLGKSLIYQFEKSDSRRQLLGNTKIILCSSDNVEIETNLQNYIGSVLYDSQYDLKEMFEEKLNKIT